AAHGQSETDQQAGEDFDPAVAVRVFRVRGFGGNRQPEQHEPGRENVTAGFQAVGDDSGGMPVNSRVDLNQGERAAHDHAGDRDALSGLHYTRAGSAFSVSTCNSAKAACARLASNLPSRARRESAAATIDSALTSKCL